VNFARDGTMFFKMTTHWTDAFRAVMDLEKGVIGAPTRVDTRSIEETASPDCSPDGRRYAYVSGPMGRALTTTARLLVHYADGRLEREVPLDKVMRRVSILRWSPDGRHIAVRMANDVDSGAVVDLVDLDNNASRPLLRGVTNNFEWSADGSALYYSDGRQILRYDIATAVTTTVLSGPYVFDVSPQDGSIAVALPLNGCTVWVLAPGEPVRMSEVRATLRDSCLAVAWSRDGQKLLVSTLKSPDPPVDLYVMDAGGGDPIHLIVPTEAINSISLGPGNRDLLFSAGNPAPEFWTLRGVGSPAKVTTMAPTPAIR
jgi:Tol biopolymer transport system component